MNALELGLAVVFITAPADRFNIPDDPAVHAYVAPRIAALARQWELLDPREVDYLKNPQDFESDLKLIKDRYSELRTAPMSGEVERFPNLVLVNDLIAFNRQYRDSVNNRLDLDMIHGDELRAILIEADLLYRIYDAVRDARCEYFYVTYRRQALAKLRELVGMQAFYTGQLPPHVPLWRIRQLP